MSDYVVFDSGNTNIEGTSTPQVLRSEGDSINIPGVHSASVLTSSEKFKRWLDWKFIGHNKYVTKEEFYLNWNKSFSIRSSLKNEIK